jgi:hypothetical protein
LENNGWDQNKCTDFIETYNKCVARKKENEKKGTEKQEGEKKEGSAKK